MVFKIIGDVQFMEEKTIISIVFICALVCMQFGAWILGFNGAVTQLVGTVLGLIAGFYFGKKNNEITVKNESSPPQIDK